MIIFAGFYNSVLLTGLIVLTYFKGYKYITDQVILFTMTDVFSAFYFSVMITAFLVFLFSTRFNDLFFNFIRRYRDLIPREIDRLKPLLEEVQAEICKKMDCKKINVVLKIKDEKHYNACAVGVKTITINRKFYEDCNDDILKAVIAHELGHIYNGDSCKSGILSILSFMFLGILSLIGVISFVCWTLSKRREGFIGISIGIISIIISMITAGIFLCLFIGFWIFHISLKVFYRHQEYRADKFAVDLGYKDGLMTFLEDTQNNDYQIKNWIVHLLSTHPKTILRIGRIEKQVKQYA